MHLCDGAFSFGKCKNNYFACSFSANGARTWAKKGDFHLLEKADQDRGKKILSTMALGKAQGATREDLKGNLYSLTKVNRIRT